MSSVQVWSFDNLRQYFVGVLEENGDTRGCNGAEKERRVVADPESGALADDSAQVAKQADVS